EHEGRHLHHDLTSQPSGHGSHGSHLEGHNVDPENYVYGSGSHTGGSNVYAPGSLDYAPGSLDYGSGSHTGGRDVYAPGSLDYGSGSHTGGRDVYAPGSLDYGSGSHTGGSNVYAPGSLDYGSGSHTGGRDVYAPGYLDYAPGSLDYSSGIPQFGPGTQSVPGIQYHDIDYTSLQEQHELDLAIQASLNENLQNQPLPGFQIRDQESAPANPPQQSTPRDNTKGKGKAKTQRKH
uniref:Uncharacterized protein n=1 Tax=Meloidogyne javanica TaxID=6303 RepID=A0A915MZE8_MELJA